MSTQPAITVLIAAYNAAGFLHRAVESALHQTLPPLEVLIVDDASTDDTRAAAERLVAMDPRVHVIALPQNGGPAKARNAGLDAAQGDWVAVLDADDAFLPGYLQALGETAARHAADIVLGDFYYYHLPSEEQTASGIAAPDGVIDRYDYAAHARPYASQSDWGLLKPMFSRRFMNDHRMRYPTFSRHGEDFLLMMETLLAGARVALCEIPGYLYTHRSSGLSRTQVNYDIMWKHTETLIADPRVKPDRRLCGLLRERVRAIRRLTAERRFTRLRSERDYAGILKGLMSDSFFITEFLRWGCAKVRGT